MRLSPLAPEARVIGTYRQTVDGLHAENEHTTDNRTRDEDVERPCLVGKPVGQGPAKHGRGVEDGHNVERHGGICGAGRQAIVRQVEQYNIEAGEPEQASEGEQEPPAVGEGRRVENGADPRRLDALAQQQHWRNESGKADEADHADAPRKSNFVYQLEQNNRVDDAAQRAARRRDASGQADLGAEVGLQDGDRGREHKASAQADAESLSQDDLPVLRSQTQHHVAEHDQEGADADFEAQVAPVVEGPADEPGRQHEESLDGANPGDIRRGLDEELARLVVRLEHSKCVEQPPCVEEDAKGAEDLQPGSRAAIWRRRYARWAGRWRGLLSGCLVVFA